MGRIRIAVRDKKEEYRKRVETRTEHIKLWDALVFSLLWSDEIYSRIPKDRNRLVVISYTLIALGLLAAFTEIGTSLMPLVIAGSLVLAAVNLLAWVVSTERGEKESLQTELRIAHDVQVSLMPKEQPKMNGYDIAGLSIPAQEVGGDHYAYTLLGGDLAISVFDVSGKGMQAAMSAVFTSGAFASEARQSGSPAEILTRLNKSVYVNTKRGHFVAFLLAALDVKNRLLRFANAGQTKPLLCSNGALRWLDTVGVTFPLGMVEDSRYQEQSIQLQAGDTLLLLTDGFTEAMNPEEELFGTDRLEQIVKQLHGESFTATEIAGRLTREVQFFMRSRPQHDDMTLVVAKVL